MNGLKKFLITVTIAVCAIIFSGCILNKTNNNIKILDGLKYEEKGNGYVVIGFEKDAEEAKNPTLVLPEKIDGKPLVEIGENAFGECYEIEEVIIPNTVTRIGNTAFQWCYNLRNITIPDTVTEIGEGAFRWCYNLISVVIGAAVEEIGDQAFYDCSKLIEIYNRSTLNISTEMPEEGEEEIDGCASYYVKNVYTEEGGSKISTDTEGYIYYTQGEEIFLVSYMGESKQLIIPEKTTRVYRYAFYNDDELEKVVFGSKITEIGECAFRGCDNLTEIEICKGLQKIGSGAFYSCDSLSYVEIPDTVTVIGGVAFMDCAELNSIVLGKGVEAIGTDAFVRCDNLGTVYYKGTAETRSLLFAYGNTECLFSAKWYYYSEIELEAENLWHYVSGIPTIW
ncbi:MAG: leucine-rich repeat domain-containing protein [Clostridia bacterium]|nr:leucine-rich repeat domain-containing protein [Clostridia bacterium]